MPTQAQGPRTAEPSRAQVGSSHRHRGRVYVVTGGTQGLGRGIAEYLSEVDAKGLIICGRNRERGEAVAAALTSGETRCVYVPADLEGEADCRAVIRAADREFGTVHGLVNAAGITDRGDLETTSVEAWDRIMAVNARAPFILMQEAVRLMKRDRVPGSIVNMVSDTAHCGQSFLTAYAASKGALATLTKNAANALRWDRIRVNGILLGWMYTPTEHQKQLEAGAPEDWLDRAEREKPFGRILRPRDLAYLVEYLLSDRAEMMTGSLIDFDQKVIGELEE